MQFSKKTISALEKKGAGLDAKEFTQRNARRWMRAYCADYRDPKTDEINHTALAEACADAFSVASPGGPLDDDTHWIWEEAAKCV